MLAESKSELNKADGLQTPLTSVVEAVEKVNLARIR
jgi:hypothetical protein